MKNGVSFVVKRRGIAMYWAVHHAVRAGVRFTSGVISGSGVIGTNGTFSPLVTVTRRWSPSYSPGYTNTQTHRQGQFGHTQQPTVGVTKLHTDIYIS